MRSRDCAQMRTFVQAFLLKTRLDLKCSLETAGQLLDINENVLAQYETGQKSPACCELLKILKKYQADLDQFALELATLQISQFKKGR